jgi:hypothetical protein
VSVEQELPFVVPASRAWAIKAIGVSCCFCAVAIVTYVNMPSLPSVIRYTAESALVVGLLFFAGVALYLMYRLLINRPVLLVDAQGIIDQSNLIGIGRLHWNEISAIRPTVYIGQEMLSIVPLDLDAVISRQRSPIRRYALRFNQRRGLGIAIAASVLSVSLPELQREIEERRPRVTP